MDGSEIDVEPLANRQIEEEEEEEVQATPIDSFVELSVGDAVVVLIGTDEWVHGTVTTRGSRRGVLVRVATGEQKLLAYPRSRNFDLVFCCLRSTAVYTVHVLCAMAPTPQHTLPYYDCYCTL